MPRVALEMHAVKWPLQRDPCCHLYTLMGKREKPKLFPVSFKYFDCPKAYLCCKQRRPVIPSLAMLKTIKINFPTFC